MGKPTLPLHENLNTVLSCARPIHFRSDYPGHELHGKGTCFIVRVAGAIWLATARHCLPRELDEETLTSLVVSRFLPRVGRAPIGELFHPIALAGPRADDADDTAGFDVVMIRTNETEHPEALDLEDEAFLSPLESARAGDPVRITVPNVAGQCGRWPLGSCLRPGLPHRRQVRRAVDI